MAIVTFNEKQTDQLRIQNQGIQGVNLASTLKELKPITLMSQDATGRKIQLWRYRQGFIGAAVNPDGSVHVVLPQNIHNSLQPQEPNGYKDHVVLIGCIGILECPVLTE